MEDSWQLIRIKKTLKGIPDEHTAREGLFDIIQKSKSHYQKRAYQCIKLLVALFSQCEVAKNLLEESEDIRQKWTWAVEWLNDELERARGPYPGSGQFSYNNWSPPAQSNETANGYFLERSQSARLTLEKACELLPEEDLEADTDAIMGEELPTTTMASTSGETGNTTAADTKSDIKLEARSTSAQSMQKSKEQQSSQITSPDLGSEETVNNSKKESGNNSVKDSTGGI
jgi:ubiquitin carboxyl-terminal hydrolase 9/24